LSGEDGGVGGFERRKKMVVLLVLKESRGSFGGEGWPGGAAVGVDVGVEDEVVGRPLGEEEKENERE